MADLYINSKYNTDGIGHVAPGRMLDPWEVGQPIFYRKETYETAVADAANDVKRIWKGLPPNIIPIRINLFADVSTSLADANLGLARTNLGAVIDDNCLADAMDLEDGSGFVNPNTPVDGMSAIAIENRGKKRLFELAGDEVGGNAADGTVIPAGGYDMVLTQISDVSAAATIAIEMWYIQG